jgi:uncharacterized membrane protein YkoI
MLILVLMTATATPVMAGNSGKRVELEDCLKAATAIRAGDFVKVEYLAYTDEGESAYEIEVRDPDGREWEFECSATTGSIIEMEQEVESANDPLFKRHMKVSESDARNTALQLYPGTVEEVEYEIEANGAASYEFDIVDKYGVEFKVEVDAASGAIVEVQMEKWEIGEEDAAR